MQLIWLLGVYVGLCAVFGPMVFFFHTYCYQRTSTALWRTRLCCYRPCPETLVTVRTEEITVCFLSLLLRGFFPEFSTERFIDNFQIYL
jgi:hypothetical protein